MFQVKEELWAGFADPVVLVGGVSRVVLALSITCSQFQFTEPSGGCDTATVEVYNQGEPPASAATDVLAYLPDVVSIAPNLGTTNGGTPVTISGGGFQAGATVLIDGVPATNVVVNPDCSTITADTPAGSGCNAAVQVTNPDTNSDSEDLFCYGPVVSGITPSEGPEAGGTDTVIDGECF